MTTRQIDQAKAEAFGGQMIGILNNGMLALMISIGHQTRLFDTMAELPPSTSAQIAAAAGLNERYVREWLGAMVTGRVVEYDPTGRTYHLPPEHAGMLTRAAGVNNFAVFAQFVPLLANVEEQVIDSFRNGGGVPYAAYPRFQAVMAEISAATFDGSLIDKVLPVVPDLVERLTAGIDVADIGCGQGHAINLMARAFPHSRFTGYDFSVEGVAAGTAEAQRMGLTNARFTVQDVAQLDVAHGYDLITAFDAIHDQAQPAAVLRNIARALRPGGTFLMADIAASSEVHENLDHPVGPAFYTVSCMHCMTVSLAYDGEGLGAMWGKQKARQMLAEAGFTNIEVKRVEGDLFNNFYIART